MVVWSLLFIFILHIIQPFLTLLFVYARPQDYWRSYWVPKASNHNDRPWEKLWIWNNNLFIDSHFIDIIYLKSDEWIISLLDAFVKLQKATISFVTSVWLSVFPHGITRFQKIGFSWNLAFEYVSKILSRKFVFRYNWTIITGTLHKDRYTFGIKCRSVILKLKNVSDRKNLQSKSKHAFHVS